MIGLYFSPSANAFFDPALGGAIPSDVVPVSSSRHAELLDMQSSGMVIVPGGDGNPAAVSPPMPTAEEMSAAARIDALEYLKSTDWYVARWAETGVPIPDHVRAERAKYRGVLGE